MKNRVIRSKLQSRSGGVLTGAASTVLLSSFSTLMLVSALLGIPNVLEGERVGSGVSKGVSTTTTLVTTETESAAGDAVGEGETSDGKSKESQKVANDPAPEGQAAEAAPTKEGAAQSIVLEKKLGSVDGHAYTVRVTYGSETNVPEGAELQVVELNQLPDDWDDAAKQANEYKNRPRDTERLLSGDELAQLDDQLSKTLEVGDDAQILWSKYLDVAIVADGQEVDPNINVQVEVETNAVPATASDALEAALLEGDQSVRLSVQNATGTKSGEGEKKAEELQSRIAFSTDRLGEIGLGQVVEKKFSWQMHGDEISVLGARSVKTDPYEVPLDLEYVNGLRLVEVFDVLVDPTHPYGTTLWVTSRPIDEASRFDGVLCYDLSGGEPKLVFGAEGTTAPVAFVAGDLMALVWDSGMRHTVLNAGDVTLVGEMPVGTTAVANDVTEAYADARALVPSDEDEQARTVAAYDVSLSVGDAAWNPGEDPVRTKVSDDVIAPSAGDKLYDVVRVGEGGATPTVAKVEDGSVLFDMSEAGSYAVVERTVVEREFTASDGNTYKITVSYDTASGLPKNAALVVNEIAPGSEGYDSYVEGAAKELGADAADVTYAKALDISIVDPETGQKYQPTKDVDVSIELLDRQPADTARFGVVHFADDGTAEAVDGTSDGNTVGFATRRFSVYVVTSYTVDFHWGEYTYSIAGESEIVLSTLLEKLGVTEITLSDIADVSFSNTELVEVKRIEAAEEQTEDWLLRSLAPFTTEEVLTLTLNNGKTFEIRVTDAVTLPVEPTDWDNGTNGSGTWEIDANGVFTVSGTGKMIDFSTNPWVKSTPWYEYIKDTSSPVKKVVISNGITRIGTNSFTRSPNLEEVDLTQCTTLETIGSESFKMDKISNVSKLKTISASNLTSLTTIELNAFNTNTALEEIDFSGCTSLTTIGSQVFYSDSKLGRVDFAGCTSLNTIGDNAFYNCSKIKYLDISDTQLTNALLVTDNTGFGKCKANLQTLKANNCGQISGVLDLSGYTSLTTLELSGCSNLTSLTLPSGLTMLDISGCTGLDSLDLSSCTNLTTVKIGNRDDQTDLSWLTLPASVTTLDASGFTSLTSIAVPASVTSLNLSGCTDLTTLDLSNTSLSDIDVSNNANLTALKLPTSATSLNVEDCPNLVIYFDGTSEEFSTLSESLNLPQRIRTITWGSYSYTIGRSRTVSLDDIFNACGIAAVASDDVDSISVSDTSVLQVNDFTVTNLQSFAEPQTLTVTLKNGFSGTIEVVCSSLEESDNLNEFLDSDTVYSYEGETGAHPLSAPAIIKQGDALHLNLSFSEVPEGQDGERQMKLLVPMSYTFPEGLTVTEFPDNVTISLSSGDATNTFTAAVTFDAETRVLTVTGDYDGQESAVSASDSVNFIVPLAVQPSTIPEDYDLGNGMILSAVKPQNVKVSVASEEYDSANGTIQYTVTVEAESDLDYGGHEYPVKIIDLSTGDSPALHFESGSFAYAHNENFELPDGASSSAVSDSTGDVTASGSFNGFPLTVSHMYEGDTITLSYTAKALRGTYTGSGKAQVQNTVTITNEDENGRANPSNIPDDDTASVTNTVPYTPLTREYVKLDGSWAYWSVTVNPDGYTLNGGKKLTLADTFDDDYPTKETKTDADQSIDYSSIKVKVNSQLDTAGIVTYDCGGNTGTYIIPDNTPVTITYRTRITAQPGDAALFRGTALLLDADGNTIASSTAGVTKNPVTIYPSPSDVGGFDDNYMVKLYVYADKQMQQGIEGAQFILLDSNQRPLEYKIGDNKGQPVTFTTGSNGYVNIELNEEDGDVSIEKNTGYYLEMMQGMEGYQKDNTLYSFMITDDPTYNAEGFYKYYNGDTIKVRLLPARPGLSVSIRFSGGYALREDQKNDVTAVLQKMEGEDNWVEVERHPYTDTQQGSIKFNKVLYDEELGEYQNIYRVVVANEKPWDLPDDIHLQTTYYCLINTGSSNPETEPQEFWASNANDSVSVVIDNRYEEPQLTIVKMDKQTGEALSGAEFSVYKIVNGEKTGETVKTYTTGADGELVIQGGEPFESEVLYGITETNAPEHYLLPKTAEWHYFYFCNDEYLEPSILTNLPEGAEAVNLTESGDRITIDNQKEKISIPVMKIWQGDDWPGNPEVVVGLYRSVEGEVDDEGNPKVEPVYYEDGITQRTVTLTQEHPYNNNAFTGLDSREPDGLKRNITYSIKEESINGMNPLEAGYTQEYGVSSAGVYIVRNKPATALTVSKEWFTNNGERVTNETVLAAQSSVTFDVYRSDTPFVDENPDVEITNADMTAFVSNLTKVRENVSFGASDGWSLTIRDLDNQDDLEQRYYYYVLETVPSFGNELYEVDDEAGTVTIKNKIAPDAVGLTVTKAPLVDDPRAESLNREFEFTLKLEVDESHPVRSWQVYTDENNPKNNLITDWDGKVTFKLKPTDPNPENQSTEGASITLNLPVGVTATVTETANPEYTVATTSTAVGTTADNGRSFSYSTSGDAVTLTYTNTLRVICKVIEVDRDPVPFESLKSALKHLRDNPNSFTSPWTIYMLEDYTIPVSDVVELREGESLTLTTASTSDAMFQFKGGEETDRAIITRSGTGGSMIKNAGTLTLENVCLDGAKSSYAATGDGGLVNSTGTLNLNNKTTLRNSATGGKGGAVYAEGTVNIVNGVSITGNSASSASALYLKGRLNMTGGSITGNNDAVDGAVVIETGDDEVYLSGGPVIFSNTNAQGKAANLYIGVDSDNIVNVVNPGLNATAQIGVTAMDGHMLIGEQFATAEIYQTDNLNRFVNDAYGYRGKLKDGTSTNIVWDGLTIKLKKVVDPVGANSKDRFTIALSSRSITMSTYIIDGTLDYTVTAARQGRPGRILFKNVKEGDDLTISPLPVGDYTIEETASNYTPVYTVKETGSAEDPVAIEGGTFSADNDCTVTVTNTRKLANVNLTKSVDDRLIADNEPQDFNFTIKLTEADGTPVTGFALANGITTNESGEATTTMSPSNNTPAVLQNLKAPVGATMTITETNGPDFTITASAITMPTEGEGTAIADEDEDNPNIFAFTVTDDGADVTFDNVRKMAEIELRKELMNKVSKTESFTFAVTLTRAGSTPAANYVMYRDTDDPSKNIVTNENGQATIIFELGENESTKSIPLTVPEGTKLVVSETDVNGQPDFYDTTYSVNGGTAATDTTATIEGVSDSDHSIVFTNTRKTNTIVVKNIVNGYSGNVVPFTYTATVTDGAENDYDANDFTDGSMTFELTTDQDKPLTVPYGATLTVEEGFIVGYETTVMHESTNLGVTLIDEFVVSANVNPLAFTNNQLIGLQLVNNTSSMLENVKVTIEKNKKIYRVNDEKTDQELIGSNKIATLSIDPGKTAILEIQHETTGDRREYKQQYTITGTTPADGYCYTIINEPSFHEYADPAIMRIYNIGSFNDNGGDYSSIKGQLRYSVNDSIVTFTDQPLVSFDSNGGVWTTEMEGYRDRDGDRKVYQKAVDKGDKVAEPSPDPVYPTAEEIKFLGWTTDEAFARTAHTKDEDVTSKLYDFETPVTAPLTLYAIWARDPNVRTVTVRNGLDADLSVTATLTSSGRVGNIEIADSVTTNANGAASFTLAAGEAKNLHVPDGVKLVLLASDGTAYSTDFDDSDSDEHSYTIDSVKSDGTVSFLGGICKITDSSGGILYKSKGDPAVYSTLADAFSAYAGTLYTDASCTTSASPAAVKLLVDEYTTLETSAIVFPNKTMTLTTAGKTDTDFPYAGARDCATIYRSTAGANVKFFTMKNGNVTLTDIVLDGGSERGVSIAKQANGGLVFIEGGTLSVESGTTLRNCKYADYTDGSNSRGGAINIKNGTLNVRAGLFTNLRARNGGAIYADGSAIMNLTGTNGSTHFENCESAVSGGAVYYNASSNLTIDGGDDNGFKVDADGKTLFDDDNRKIEASNPGIVFNSCVAKDSDEGNGGAIFINSNGTASIKGCSFIECSARVNKNDDRTRGGGAIAAKNVNSITVSNCTFSACDTLTTGGAVFAKIKDGTSMTVNNCIFRNDSCKGQGGGIGVYQVTETAKTTAQLTVNGCRFENCSSGTQNGSGGAIQSYLPCMFLNDSDFTDCWAGKEGGGINNYFGSNYAEQWSGSFMTITGCEFTRCRAEDRFQVDIVIHYGGAINTKVKTVNVEDCKFEDCVSTLRDGGALHLGGCKVGSSATIKKSTFTGCTAKKHGGAVFCSTETLEISDSKFYGCVSTSDCGGAVYHGMNCRSEDNVKKETKITDCEFKQGCGAAINGSAVWTAAQSAEVENCIIEGCASGNSGAIYLSEKDVKINTSNNKETGTTEIAVPLPSGALTRGAISNGTITGCEAPNGSAVYVGHSAIFSSTLNVSGNIVSDINSGAIQTTETGKLYFEGNVKVENNTCSGDSTYKHDVLMQNDNETTIYTTSNGLGSEAKIGVYVPDSISNKRALEGQAFGTYNSSTTAGSNYLDAFFNDRDSELYGCQLSETDRKIYWGIFICKITDAAGNTLKRANGRDAVYQRLYMALDEFTTVAGGTPFYVKMLLENYNLRQSDAISNFPAADITLTTEAYTGTDPVEGQYDGKHPYRGTSGTVCTVSRINSANELFHLETEDAKFRLENITLAGRKDEGGNDRFRLIEAEKGELYINPGTTLQHGSADNGGAIYATGAPVFVNLETNNTDANVKFLNCTATANGGAIYANNLTIRTGESGGKGTLFRGCVAVNGGAVCVSGSTMSINGAQFENCRSAGGEGGEGGAAYHSGVSADTSTINNSIFTSCIATTSGGAVSSKAGTMELTKSTFDGCDALQNGGAINHVGTTRTAITGTVFKNCKTKAAGAVDSYGFGGSVYTQAATVEIVHDTFQNSTAYNHGGALYCQNNADGSATTVFGSTFESCSTTRGTNGSGGAIYSESKVLTLQKYTPEGSTTGIQTTINACTAPGYSGAVHMATTGSVLNITDGTVISNCYANKGGAIYLPSGVTLNLTESPEFTQNGYTTQDGNTVDADAGACIYLEEGSRINLKNSPRFSRNILPNEDRIPNGGVTDFVRQDIYMAGYESTTELDTNAASIYVVGELTGDTIWVWPEEAPHRKPNEQFAKIQIAEGGTVSADSLAHLRNALADGKDVGDDHYHTDCTEGEYLAGVQVGNDTENVYWDKMYIVSFMKRDNKGVAVPGAEFTLYRYQDLATVEETVVFKPENVVATAVSSGVEGKERGKVEFTSVRIGVYYMKETKVPTSFKENNATYLVLVGTPYLKRNESNKSLWVGNGPLNVDDAENLVAQHTTNAGKYYGIFALDENKKAVLRANLASSSVGIQNVRDDYQVAFMKVGGNNDPLPGAAFTIYTAILDASGQPDTLEDGYPKLMRWSRDGESYPAPVVSADGTSAYKDKDNHTLPKGMVYFRELPIGTYYLLETAYPERNGSGRRTYYEESDRVFKLDVEEDEGSTDGIKVTLSEWKKGSEGSDATYELLSKSEDGYYVVSNREVVCKLTDDSDNLLYVQGHKVWENKESEETARLFPAIYATLEEGFEAAQTGYFAYESGSTANVESSLKLKVLKDFTLSNAIDPVFYDSGRDITFTTAETKVVKDRYIFSTTRTSDTSRAEIKRAYGDDANARALITVASGARLTLQNIKLNGQKSKFNGRAIHVLDGSCLTIGNNTQFQNFKQENGNGGAVLMDSGTTLTINGGSNRSAVFTGNTAANGGALFVSAGCTVSGFKNAQFTQNTATDGGAVSLPGNESILVGYAFTNVVFKNNNAANNGGAVLVNEYCPLTLNNCTFTGNAVTNNGGAVYAASYAQVTISSGSVKSNTAVLGSAVYANNNARVTITSASITGNKAKGENGGAINTGGANARLYFGGDVTVFDNTLSTDTSQQRNLVLSENTNEVINTTESGLQSGTIGVFVIGSDPAGEESRVFEEHGLPGNPFGTFGDSGHLNPQVFRSDHALALYGIKMEDDFIHWVDVLCKLTDTSDKILYQDIYLTINGKTDKRKAQAVYARITEPDDPKSDSNGFDASHDGFDAAENNLYSKNGNKYTTYSETADIKLKMLKDVSLDKAIQYGGTRRLTFTTAEPENLSEDNKRTMREAGDYFLFQIVRTDGDKDKARITRAFDGDSMINDLGTGLTVANITLDGNKESNSTDKNGGIVNVQSGSALTVAEGAILRNATTTGNGGAIYVGAGTLAVSSGASITGCQATDGGAAYLAAGATMSLEGTSSTATTITGNAATTVGAGIYLAEGSTLELSGNPSFGGTDQDADGKLRGEEGNFVSKAFNDTDFLEGATNGGEDYPENPSDNTKRLVRQDIFIAGYEGEDGVKNAASLVVNGSITSGEGSIWVWADKSPHYKSLEQFATIKQGVTVTEESLGAFRNAQTDDATGNPTDTYLHGIREDGEDGFVLWNGSTGSCRVILRKIGSDIDKFVPLSGVEFTIYKGATPGTNNIVVNNEDPANPNKNVWTSDATGVFFAGMLPYGTYCVQEKRETIPDGYTKPSDDPYKVFQIKEDGVWDATGQNSITEFTM